MTQPRALWLALCAGVIFALGGCDVAGAPGPSATTVMSGTPSPVPDATITPTATTPGSSMPAPSDPAIIYDFTFHGGPGGHGGSPLLDLQAPVAIDYAVVPGCALMLEMTFGVPDEGIEAARFTISAGTPWTSGTWLPKLKPGPYYLIGREGDDTCPFHISVRLAGPSGTPAPSPVATAATYTEFWKTEPIVDGHGGSPFMDFPANLQVDYELAGTCTFGFSLYAMAPEADFAMPPVTARAAEVTGTWLVTIPAGSYEPVPSESDGCTFHLSVHAPD